MDKVRICRTHGVLASVSPLMKYVSWLSAGRSKVRSTIRGGPAKPRQTRHRAATIPPWAWAAPVAIGLLIGAFFLGQYVEAERWRIDVPPEIAEVWEGIDLLAAHPDDPDKPEDVPGVSDEEIATMSEEDVNLLLSDWVISVAASAPEPRYLFEIGRVALIHDQAETAYDLLEMANAAGSVPAPMYLASYFEEENPEQARALVDSAIVMGFAPAAEYRDTLFGTGTAGTRRNRTETPLSEPPEEGHLW